MKSRKCASNLALYKVLHSRHNIITDTVEYSSLQLNNSVIVSNFCKLFYILFAKENSTMVVVGANISLASCSSVSCASNLLDGIEFSTDDILRNGCGSSTPSCSLLVESQGSDIVAIVATNSRK